MRSLLAVPLLLLALGACGVGGSGRPAAVTAPVSTGASVSTADQAWLTMIHQADLADVQYGRLAARKGATSAVRHAGAMLATGHAALDAKVTHVAGILGIDLPATERADQLALAQRLQKESGSRFDRAFVTAMVQEHDKAVAATEREIGSGSSPEVTALAHSALPDLREHLAMLHRANPIG
jgi:putative membrane protein